MKLRPASTVSSARLADAATVLRHPYRCGDSTGDGLLADLLAVLAAEVTDGLGPEDHSDLERAALAVADHVVRHGVPEPEPEPQPVPVPEPGPWPCTGCGRTGGAHWRGCWNVPYVCRHGRELGEGGHDCDDHREHAAWARQQAVAWADVGL